MSSKNVRCVFITSKWEQSCHRRCIFTSQQGKSSYDTPTVHSALPPGGVGVVHVDEVGGNELLVSSNLVARRLLDVRGPFIVDFLRNMFVVLVKDTSAQLLSRE